MAPKAYVRHCPVGRSQKVSSYCRKGNMSKKARAAARKAKEAGPRRSGRKHVSSLRRSKRTRGKGFNPFKGLVRGLSTLATTGNPLHAGISGIASTFS